MAGLHNELQRDVGLLAAFQAALGEKSERFTGLERAGETLTPIIDLWSKPEWADLRGERLAVLNRAGPAVAGELGAVAVLCPSGSIVVVEEATLDPGGLAASTVMTLSLVTEAAILATLATPSAGISRDSRDTTVTRTTTVAGSHATQIGSVAESVRVPAGNMPISRMVPWVLSPGFGLVMMLGTANTSFLANFKVRERRALPGEL